MRFFFIVLCCMLCSGKASSQTLNWGNEILGQVVDSTGAEVDNTFVFELGAFDSGFTPTQGNISQWYSNWNIFDFTTYDTNPLNDRFTSTVFVLNGEPGDPSNIAISSNTDPKVSTMNFSGLEAYIWVRKGDQPIEGSEWLLVNANSWDFPAKGEDCCSGGASILEFSTATDLGTTLPLWGRQNGTRGPGEGIFDEGGYNPATDATLQTFTFIPEPSTFLLSAVTATGFLLRRRRS